MKEWILFLDRRDFLADLLGSVLLPSKAWSQESTLEPVDPFKLAARLAEPRAIDTVFADVAFLQSWRGELAPRGYENTAEWMELARQNRSDVWARLFGNAQSMLAAMTGEVQEFDKRALDAYAQNRSAFDDFLSVIGVDPNGKAGLRIVQSLRDFALLNVVAFQGNADDQAKSSFFWPFC